MPAGDVFKTTLEWRYSSIDVAVQNVLYFLQVGSYAGPTPLPELDLGARIKSVWNRPNGAGDYRGQYISPAFTFLNVRVQRVYAFPTSAYLTTVNVAGGGLDAPVYVPSICSMLVRLRTSLNTRRGTGRLFLGGFAGVRNAVPLHYPFASHGYWSDTYRNIASVFLQAVWDQCRVPGDSGVYFDWGVWSRADAGVSLPYTFAFSPLASFEIPAAIRLQHSREVGVGI